MCKAFHAFRGGGQRGGHWENRAFLPPTHRLLAVEKRRRNGRTAGVIENQAGPSGTPAGNAEGGGAREGREDRPRVGWAGEYSPECLRKSSGRRLRLLALVAFPNFEHLVTYNPTPGGRDPFPTAAFIGPRGVSAPCSATGAAWGNAPLSVEVGGGSKVARPTSACKGPLSYPWRL